MYSIKTRLDNEISINKSRFIGIIIPIQTEDQAKNELEKIRKTYLNATHYTYAYILGDSGTIQKASDDGEPTRTAGYPILEVMHKNNLTNAILIVVRYFGGIKLGAGGLIRAYSKCASEAVAMSVLTEKNITYTCRLSTNYDNLGNIDKYIRENTELQNVAYDKDVEFTFKINSKVYDEVKEALFNKNDFENRLEIIEEHSEYS